MHMQCSLRSLAYSDRTTHYAVHHTTHYAVHHATHHAMPHTMQAVGSLPLGRRVRAMRPHMHVFGHSHFGWDQTLDGTR